MQRTIVINLNWQGEPATLKLPFADRVKTTLVTLSETDKMQVAQSIANGGIGIMKGEGFTFTRASFSPEPINFPLPVYIAPGCIESVKIIEE